jgi:hypothetical protein
MTSPSGYGSYLLPPPPPADLARSLVEPWCPSPDETPDRSLVAGGVEKAPEPQVPAWVRTGD